MNETIISQEFLEKNGFQKNENDQFELEINHGIFHPVTIIVDVVSSFMVVVRITTDTEGKSSILDLDYEEQLVKLIEALKCI